MTRIEVYGSTQGAFINQPSIIVSWNGHDVGVVEHGGEFVFDVDGAGVVAFRYLFRSAKVTVPDGGVTAIQLRWDRLLGRLLAKIVPAR